MKERPTRQQYLGSSERAERVRRHDDEQELLVICERCGQSSTVCESCQQSHDLHWEFRKLTRVAGPREAYIQRDGWYCFECEVEMSLIGGDRLCPVHAKAPQVFVVPRTHAVECPRCWWQREFVRTFVPVSPGEDSWADRRRGV